MRALACCLTALALLLPVLPTSAMPPAATTVEEGLSRLLDREGEAALSKRKRKRVQKVFDALTNPPTTGLDRKTLRKGTAYLAKYQDGEDIVLRIALQSALLLAEDTAFTHCVLQGELDGLEGLSDRKRSRLERQLRRVRETFGDHIGAYNLLSPNVGAKDPGKAAVLTSLKRVKQADGKFGKIARALEKAGGFRSRVLPSIPAANPADTALHFFAGGVDAALESTPGGAAATRGSDGEGGVVWTILIFDRQRTDPAARLIRIQVAQQGDTLTGLYGQGGVGGLTIAISGPRGIHSESDIVGSLDFGDVVYHASSPSLSFRVEIDGQFLPIRGFYQYDLTDVQVTSL